MHQQSNEKAEKESKKKEKSGMIDNHTSDQIVGRNLTKGLFGST